MKLELVPMLRVQRELYEIPRGWARFRRYLEVMTGGTRDMVLPLPAMNPMGKEHVAAVYNELLVLEAEVVAGEAVATAHRRLSRARGALKVGLVVADDVAGGWTNRYLTEVAVRFNGGNMLKRGWAVVLLWTSEAPTREHVRQAVLETIYRAGYQQQHGEPKTLRQMMAQEGLAAAFAGFEAPAIDSEGLAAIREVIRPRLDSRHFPTVFACLYGDEAARSVGYLPLGLADRAGYALATAEALQRRVPPEAELLSAPVASS